MMVISVSPFLGHLAQLGSMSYDMTLSIKYLLHGSLNF